MKNWLLFFVMFFVLPLKPRADQTGMVVEPCVQMLAVDHFRSFEFASSTDSLLALLGKMEERGLMNSETYHDILKFLDEKVWLFQNPAEAEARLYWRSLEALLRSDIEADKIREHVGARLKLNAEEWSARKETIEDVKSTFRLMRFVRISGGHFRMPMSLLDSTLSQIEVDVEMPYDLEVLDVPVTQGMWSSVMGENLAGAKGRVPQEEFFPVSINGKDILIAPDYPVDDLSLASAMEFANRVSALYGYPSAYVSHPTERIYKGRAGDGTLGGFNYWFTDLQIGDNRGFRLPTTYEWYRLVGNFSQERQRVIRPKELLQEVGWFGDEPWGQRTLKPVAQLRPILVDSQSVFDLVGNVAEITHDVHISTASTAENPALELTPPSPYDLSCSRVGGCVFTELNEKAFPDQSVEPLRSSAGKQGLGFRLVRSVPRQEAQ